MNYSSGAPVRQPVPELPEDDFRDVDKAPSRQRMLPSGQSSVAHLRLIWNNRRFVIRAGICAFCASVALALLIPARYESTARLMPPDNQSGAGLAMAAAALSGGGASGGLAAGGLGGIASELLGVKSSSDIFVGILRSRTVEDKLIQQFDLQKLYNARRMEDARKALANQTDVSVDRKSQIISITVTDKSPERAAAMSQSYVEQLNTLVAALSTSSARRERIFLEGRLQGVKLDLEAAEKDFSEFSSRNTAIDIKEQGKAMVEAAAMLQGQLIAAQSQYEGLREIYTDNNERVRATKARIDELRRQLEKLGGKGEGSTNVAAEADGSIYPSIRKLPLLGVTYADLYRRSRIQEAVLEVLTKEYELARVQEAKEIPTVKVLDNAQVPDKKSFPPRTLFVFLGTTLGLSLAISWLFGKSAWDQTAPDDPRKVFAQEVFTTVRGRLPKFARNGSGGPDKSDLFQRFPREQSSKESSE